MSGNKTSKDLLIVRLFKDRDITFSTIDALLKYGFDTNDALLTIDVDMDLPQMHDICLSQRSLLRRALTKYRRQYFSQTSDPNIASDGDEKDNKQRTPSPETTDDDNESESTVKTFKSRLGHNVEEEVAEDEEDEEEEADRSDGSVGSDVNIDAIVDQLRESLIRVEKQKQEKDFQLNRKCLEITVKDMEIKRLESELKQMERQLICEKLMVEKLNHRLNTSAGTGCRCRRLDNRLDKLKTIYYNYNHNNSAVADDESLDGDQQSDDCIPFTPLTDNSRAFPAKFVNLWREVNTTSSAHIIDSNDNTNSDDFNASLFASFVSPTATTTTTDSTGQSPPPTPTGDDRHRLVGVDADPFDETPGARDTVICHIGVADDPKALSIKQELLTDGSDDDDSDEDNCSSVEAIVCEPDLESVKPVAKQTADNTVAKHKPIGGKTRPKTRKRKNNKSSTVRRDRNGNYRCDYGDCHYKFVSSDGLKRHVRSIHMKERPFLCEYEDCGKAFGRSDALREHMKRHYGLKSYKCDYEDCKFESVSSNSLKRHVMSVHLKERHFRCDYQNCGKTFARKDSLKKHRLNFRHD